MYGALVRRGAPETFDPTPPSLGLARALTYVGDLAAARAAFPASRLPANDASLRYYRAVLAYCAGEFRNATDLAQALGSALPNYPPLELLLGGASLASGFPATAVAHLGRYVAMRTALARPALAPSHVVLHMTVHGDGDYFKVHSDAVTPEIARREIGFVYYFMARQPCGFSGGTLRLFETLSTEPSRH